MVTSNRLFRLAVRFALLVGAWCLTLSSPAAESDAAKTEIYVMPSVALTDQQFLMGAKNGRPSNITGELRLPTLGTSKVPAMLIVHGSGGILGNEEYWSRTLNDMGIATFVLDMFTPRGITSVGSDQTQLGFLTMINDAYRGLDQLAQHPRIDANRIGILGGSRGGRATLYASVKRFQKMHGTPGLEFALYLAFYAPCYTEYVEDDTVSDRPIRLFHGTADDGVPIDACRSYAERLRRKGADVQLFAYDGAAHLFDNPILPKRQVPNAQTMRRCSLLERPTGSIINSKTGAPFAFTDPCVERGYTQGYDAAAIQAATKTVQTVVKDTFGLQ